MNRTFKVTFNKARGALMVVNEVTSSVQAKGTKTVVAAAVASVLAFGSAALQAAEADDTLVLDWDSVTTATDDYKLPTFKFHSGKGQTTVIRTNADANKLLTDLAANENGLSGILAALGQVNEADKTGILAGFAGGCNFLDDKTPGVLLLAGIVLDKEQKQLLDKISQQFKPYSSFSVIEGSTQVQIGGDGTSPVLLGSVGADRLLNTSVQVNLAKPGTGFDGLKWDEPNEIVVTRNGNSNLELLSGNLIGHVNASSAINVGPVLSLLKANTQVPIIGAKDIWVRPNAGTTTTILNGNSTLNITGTGCAAGAFAGGSAIALGGAAESQVTGNSTIVLNNDKKNEANGSINTLSIGLIGGGLSVATLGGTSTSTVGGETLIDLQKGLAVGVMGGGMALTADPTDVAGAIPEDKKDNILIDEDAQHAAGSASATSGNVAIKVGSGATVAGVLGGGLAASYQYGDATTAAASTASVGDVVIRLGDAVETGKALTDEEKGKLFKTVKDFAGALQKGEGLAGIKDAAVDFAQEIDDFEGVTVGVVGGGMALAYDRERGGNNGELTAKAQSSVKSVGIQVNSGYNVALVGGGFAAGSGHSLSGEDVLASANVTGDVVMNFAGGETVGVMGGGIALWAGKKEAHDGIGAEANVGRVSINVVGGDVDGIVGGGLAVDDTNPVKNGNPVRTKNASAHVNEVTIYADKGNIGRLSVESFEGIQNEPGSDAQTPELQHHLKDALNAIQKKKVAVLSGGMASGMRADGDVAETAGSVVDKASVRLGGTVVVGEENEGKRANVFGGGLAVVGAGTYVGESNIEVAGATIHGDVYGGGIAVGGKYGSGDAYNKALSEVGVSKITLASGTLDGDLYAGGLTHEPTGADGAAAVVKNSQITVAKDFVFKGRTIDGSGADEASLTFVGGYDFAPVEKQAVVVKGFDELRSDAAVAGAVYDFGTKVATAVNGIFDFDGIRNGTDKTMRVAGGAVAVSGTFDNAFDVEKGVLALGTHASASDAADGMSLYTGEAALYLSGDVSLDGKTILVGTTAEDASGVTVGSDAMLIVDASVVGSEEAGDLVTNVTGRVSGEEGSTLHFVNVADQGVVHVDTTIGEANWTVDNVLFDAVIGEDGNVSFEVVTDAGKLEDLGLGGFDGDALAGISKQDDAASETIKDLLDQTGAVTSGERRHAQLNASLNLAAAAGVQTAGIEGAMLGIDQATKRASLTNVFKDGWTGFAEVTGAKLKFGGERGALETKTDLTGVAVGGEYTVGDMTFGLLGNFGTGDVEGEGDNGGVQNDVDYYGLQAYAAKRIGQFNAVAQMGYLMTENDITHDRGDAVKVDADVFTVGARGEMTYALNDDWSAVPYVGLNYLRVATDGYATKAGFKVGDTDQDLVNLPIGISVAGDCSTHGGWTVRPTVDVAYVHTFGDTDFEAETTVGKFDVGTKLDVWSENVGRLNVGVEARKDNMAFGINLGGAVGSTDHSEVFGNVSVKYLF